VTDQSQDVQSNLPSQVTGYLNLILSHGLTVVAGALAAKGVLTTDQSSQFVTVGAALLLYAIGQGYSLLIQYYRRKQAVAAVAIAAATPVKATP
jgi:hypothetical protein